MRNDESLAEKSFSSGTGDEVDSVYSIGMQEWKV